MRNNRIRTLLAVLLIGTCLSATAYADTALVTGSEVNVRSGPGKDYAVLGSYSRGSSVEVIDRSNPDWYAVRYGNQTGYMSSGYLSIQEDSQPAQVTTVQPTVQPAEQTVGQATVLVPGQATIVLPGQEGIVITAPPTTPTPVPTLTAPVATPTPTREPTLAAPSGVPSVSQTPTLAAPTPVPAAAPTPVPTPAPTAAPVTVVPGSTGQIDGMYVRFRSGPSSSSAILGEYNRGKALTVLGVDGDWTMCQIDGETGYVFSQYVSVSASASTAAPANAPTLASAPAPTGIVIESTPAPTSAPVPAPAQTTAQTSASIAGDHVRFRSGPSTGYSILGTYDRGKALTVLGTEGDWTYCTIDGQSGYVFTQYVQTASAAQTALPAPTLATGTLPAGFTAQPAAGTSVSSGTTSTSTALTGYIKGNNVRFRAGPDLSSEILRELFYGNAVTILGTDGTWTAISYEGESGYVFSQYVATGTYQPVSSGGTATGREIADFALQYVGTPYCWGGKDPSTGFDCSGFMYFVFQHFGYTLNRVASEQALNGRHIEASELQPGDLLCFYSGGSYIGHVGLYIGNNTFVHAATSTTGVITSELTGYYAKRGFEARRIAG